MELQPLVHERRATKAVLVALAVIALVMILSKGSEERFDSIWVSNKARRSKFIPKDFLPDFQGAVFTGHLEPDLDSVASAIGAAYLFKGVATVPGELNSETQFVLKKYGVEHPKQLSKVYDNQEYVLLDHNSAFQKPTILDHSDLRGIIDHHALSQHPAFFVKPGFVLIYPWGSCSTIVGSLYAENDVTLPEDIAGVLLGGIVSDTLGLTGPTTTQYDREVAFWLAEKARIKPSPDSIRRIAKAQFIAKANISDLSFLEMTQLDMKEYELKAGQSRKGILVSWSTIETVDPFYSKYLKGRSIAHFQKALMQIKVGKGLRFAFLSIVDILDKRSVFIVSSREEMNILRKAFPKRYSVGLTMNASPLVSRKKEFIPALRRALRVFNAV